jgi:hypothetical protein
MVLWGGSRASSSEGGQTSQALPQPRSAVLPDSLTLGCAPKAATFSRFSVLLSTPFSSLLSAQSLHFETATRNFRCNACHVATYPPRSTLPLWLVPTTCSSHPGWFCTLLVCTTTPYSRRKTALVREGYRFTPNSQEY